MNGVSIKGFQERIEISNSVVGEIWALLKRFLAKDLNFDFIYVESDDWEAVNMIVNGENEDKSLIVSYSWLQDLFEVIYKIKIRHIYLGSKQSGRSAYYQRDSVFRWTFCCFT